MEAFSGKSVAKEMGAAKSATGSMPSTGAGNANSVDYSKAAKDPAYFDKVWTWADRVGNDKVLDKLNSL
jgi:hypothetical protein